MGFKAYFDTAQRQAYACEAQCGRHGSHCEDLDWSRSPHSYTRSRVPELSWGRKSLPALLPCSPHSSLGVLWMKGGVYPSCGSYFEAAHQTAEVQPWAFLMFSVLGIIGTLSSVISRMPSVGVGGFWAVQPSGLAGAAGHCNGLRSLVPSNRGKWTTT